MTEQQQSYKIIRDEGLVKAAATPDQGRQFCTCGSVEDATRHIQDNPNDVCMVRFWQQETQRIVMLGGPIPRGALLDIDGYDFSHIRDSFDVGEMTKLVEQWFRATQNGKQGMYIDFVCCTGVLASTK